MIRDPGALTGEQRLVEAIIRAAVDELPPARLRAWLREPIFADWCSVAGCSSDSVRAGIEQVLAGRRVVVLRLDDPD